jgi:lauroyl/myristoyl acyltransferase
MAGKVKVDNAQVALDVIAEGRGAILNFMHHGPFVALTEAMQNVGIHPYAAIAPFYFEEPVAGYNGHRDRRHMLTLRAGAKVFSAAGSFPLVLAIIQDGRVMGLSTDVPGSAEMTFLGRRVRAASGCTKASLRTGAPIIPISMHRHTREIARARIEDPIDPKDFPTVEALQQRIADVHEPAVLDWPEALEWPLQRWTPADPAEAEEFGFPPPA